MAFSEELAGRIREILVGTDGLSEKKMFGGLAFLMNGHMACGVNDDRLMLRLGNELADEARDHRYVSEMDFTGRSLKSMVYVEPEGITTESDLREWVELAVGFARTLPPK